MAQRILYLLRHGQADLEKTPVDKLGNGLSNLGKEQVALTAQRLRELPITSIHYSTLRRSTDTTKIITSVLSKVPVHSSHLLWECIPYLPPEFIEWYTRAPEEEKRICPGQPERNKWLSLWTPSTRWEYIEHGFRQSKQAYNAYFRPAEKEEQRDLIISHGNLIRYFICRVLQAPLSSWISIDSHNCGLSEIVVRSDGQMILVSHNDTGHIPLSMRTYV